ncbi:TIGR03086 family metal-binding protein [Actinomadura sp. NPDC049382]|uniref:TIGR03086 family metal-binding protein n=1 Tax=Actinomadura sp. NPDC049382 TaxID=3158220 RepID=UPI00343D7E2C
MNDLHAYMKECAAEAARVARGVDRERLAGPTPCAEFDLRALVNHWVVFTSHGLERRALREQLPEQLIERDFTADPAWAEEYAAQLDRAVAAWADPAVWEGEIDLGSAASPASEVASLLILETALHGFDVAAATGQEFGVSAEAGEFLLGVVEEQAELYRQYDGFADPVPVDADAPAFRRAVALSGRDPGWTPPA